jgi:ABC-type phosphate transport system substrate-binding protein
MRTATLTCVLVALAGTAAPIAAQPPREPSFFVIAHPSTRTTSVSRAFLADVFLKKKTRWPGDKAIRPVDLDPKSSARQRFSDQVLRRSTGAVRNYWRQLIFSGRGVPPPELDHERDVIAYVGKHEGAIGYVSASAGPLVGVKILAVE